MRRYAFIVPRFADGIVGGAETLVGKIAAKLSLRGDKVEVFTTCAKDNRTWEDHYQEGSDTAFGVKVHRFKVNKRNLDRWIPLQIGISEGLKPNIDDQLTWIKEGVNSDDLYKRLKAERENFDAFFFAPYLFGTTFWGALVNPDRSFLIPCLHDEHYAYLEIIGSLFRQVRGAIFNAAPEMDLANALYGKINGGEVGMGFEEPENISDIEPYFKEKFPYLLYCGRKETGKNVQLLLDYFVNAKEEGQIDKSLKLVIAGGGSFDDLARPQYLNRADIIDLSAVSEEEKLSLIKNAKIFCQLSTNESFSIVIMEAWLLGVPVMVHSACQVTRYHALQSGGGLYVNNQDEFSAIVNRVVSDENLAIKLGNSGRNYVQSFYNWESVLNRFDTIMDQFL